jgi:hypothetical protein
MIRSRGDVSVSNEPLKSGRLRRWSQPDRVRRSAVTDRFG